MAHTLTADDLLYPKGDLPLTLFPDKAEGKTAQDALTLWLAEAQIEIVNVPSQWQNDAAKHYCYAKAYRAQANRLGATPSSVTDNGAPMSVTKEWSDNRVKYWDTKAEAEEAAFNNLLPADEPAPAPAKPMSGSVRVKAVF